MARAVLRVERVAMLQAVRIRNLEPISSLQSICWRSKAGSRATWPTLSTDLNASLICDVAGINPAMVSSKLKLPSRACSGISEGAGKVGVYHARERRPTLPFGKSFWYDVQV